jgi:hypothetical protein
MPATSDPVLALAERLRALADTELTELLSARELRAGITDFFDLADALLEPDSVHEALKRLDRPTLASLAALAERGPSTEPQLATRLASLGSSFDVELAAPRRLALVFDSEGGVEVPRAVADELALRAPSLAELVTVAAPAALASVSPADPRFTDRVAAERAFETTTAIATFVAEVSAQPARELARGGLALPEAKRLASIMRIELGTLPTLVEIASRGELVASVQGWVTATPAGTTWLAESTSTRWARLAGAWLDRLPGDVRSILSSRSNAIWDDRLGSYIDWLFPAGGQWMRERMHAFTRDAETLGITADATPTTPGSTLLGRGPDAAAETLRELLPAEVTQVYLQHDLSIVSPGPLIPQLDARLHTMAEVETRALASTYRITSASLQRALAAGETADTIVQFLGEISLTGIPQPLSYLIAEASERYGLVRVYSEGSGAIVRSIDQSLLRTMAVDQALRPLALARSGESSLHSRFERDIVYWALMEARYPVVAVDASDEVITLERRRTMSAQRPATRDRVEALIERLRIGDTYGENTDDAWMARQLDAAIRGKLALTVTVRMPDGSENAYQLEPASVASGRLRARDRKADIERTLPLANITSVGPPAL